jgi:hypothetical protein
MDLGGLTVPGLVIELLYVQRCPCVPAALSLVQRICAELAVDTEVRTILIPDQAAAERARFLGSPTVRVAGRDVDPGWSWPPSTPWSVGCIGMSIGWPAIPRSAGSARPWWRRPAGPEPRAPGAVVKREWSFWGA